MNTKDWLSRSEVRALAAGHNLSGEHGGYVRAVARGAHEELCGSWEAAGFDTKFEFLIAADYMVKKLAERGLDLFSFPGEGWRTSDPYHRGIVTEAEDW